MNTQDYVMKTMAIYSDDNHHRFLLEKSWESGENAVKKAMIIMLFPCASDLTQLDLTTMLCLNNAAKLGFTGILTTNLYSKLNANISHDIAEINASENDSMIEKTALECDTIIIAWGHGNNSKKVTARQNAVLKILRPYAEKVMTLVDERGVTGLHPLTPSLRSCWNMTKYAMPEFKDDTPKEELGTKKKGGGRKKKEAQAEMAVETATEAETDTEESA